MPTLIVLQGPDKGQRFHMVEGKPFLIGRASTATPLTDYTVSRRHAEIRPHGRGWQVDDLRSANGTYLNDRRLERPTRLKDGDKIRTGGTVMVWDSSETAGETPMRVPASISGTRLDLETSIGSDPSILGAVGSGDDSMILATPVAAEAVRTWRVISALLDAVGSALKPEALVRQLLDLVFEEVPADRGFILLRNERTGHFETEAIRAPDETSDKMRASRRIVDHVLDRREGILCSNALSDERFREPGGRGLAAIGLRSVICVPLSAHEDALGVIYVDCEMSKHIYTEEQLRLVAAIGRMAGMAIENARLLNERMRTERLAAAGETVAALSHSIKNILQGLKGGSEVVEMGLKGQKLDTVEQGWEIMRRNLENIFALTMNMLAFAKRREPRRAPVQLLSLVEDVLKLARARADDKGAMLKTDLDEHMPAMHLDEHGIHQAVLNIVANAIDAVAPTTGVVTVKLKYDADREEAVLTVGDNGDGIPEDERERIFDPFFSTKGHGGTGLGLPVAKKIVEEHQGRISLKSVTGEGTLIRVVLPSIPPGTTVDSAATHGPAGA